ncbi:hypothetical protein WJX72_010229 [[Myrmecia] bisecta]|uniref:Uncharacterized protein n=1 Tax=[Myrmecia] bisecta TaxID=41462 RepID=A0AAW1Q0N7_9CHLO
MRALQADESSHEGRTKKRNPQGEVDEAQRPSRRKRMRKAAHPKAAAPPDPEGEDEEEAEGQGRAGEGAEEVIRRSSGCHGGEEDPDPEEAEEAEENEEQPQMTFKAPPARMLPLMKAIADNADEAGALTKMAFIKLA